MTDEIRTAGPDAETDISIAELLADATPDDLIYIGYSDSIDRQHMYHRAFDRYETDDGDLRITLGETQTFTLVVPNHDDETPTAHLESFRRKEDIEGHPYELNRVTVYPRSVADDAQLWSVSLRPDTAVPTSAPTIASTDNGPGSAGSTQNSLEVVAQNEAEALEIARRRSTSDYNVGRAEREGLPTF